MTVKAGDHMAAHVKFIPEGDSKVVSDRGHFVLSLNDKTTGESFTVVQGPLKPGSYQRSSAEWILERPVFYNPGTKQAVFAGLPESTSAVVFTKCRAMIAAPSIVPINYDGMWMAAPFPSGYGYGDAYGMSNKRYAIAKTDLGREILSATAYSL